MRAEIAFKDRKGGTHLTAAAAACLLIAAPKPARAEQREDEAGSRLMGAADKRNTGSSGACVWREAALSESQNRVDGKLFKRAARLLGCRLDGQSRRSQQPAKAALRWAVPGEAVSCSATPQRRAAHRMASHRNAMQTWRPDLGTKRNRVIGIRK